MPSTLPAGPRSWISGLAIVAPLVLLIVVGTMNHLASVDLVKTKQKVQEIMERKEQAAMLLKSTLDNEAGQRGFILSENPLFLEPYNQSLLALPAMRKSLAAAISDPKETVLFNALNVSIDRRLEFSAATVDLQYRGDHVGSVAMVQTGQGKMLMDQVRTDAAALTRNYDQEILGYEAKYGADVKWDEVISWCLVGVYLLMAAVLLAFLRRLQRTENFVSVCAWSKTVEFQGEWITFEEYLSRRFGFSISHGISPVEADKLLGEFRSQRIEAPVKRDHGA